MKMSDWLLTNGTAIDVLSIGEDALDEERLLYLRRRVARLLGLGRDDEPFPYVTRKVMEALMVPGPLAIQNGRFYMLTGKGLRLYSALLDAVREVKGREAVRQLEELRKLSGQPSEAQPKTCPRCGLPYSYLERHRIGSRVYLYAVHYEGYEKGPDGRVRKRVRKCYLGPEEALQEAYISHGLLKSHSFSS